MLQACNLYLNTCGGSGSYRAGPTALLITCVSGAKNMQTQQKIKKNSDSITDDNAGSGIIRHNSRRDAGNEHILADGL